MNYHRPDDMLRCEEAVAWAERIDRGIACQIALGTTIELSGPPFWKGLDRELSCFALEMYRLGRRDAFGVLEAAMREDELSGKGADLCLGSRDEG